MRVGRELAQPRHHLVYDPLGGGGTSRHAGPARASKPVRVELLGSLNVVSGGAGLGAYLAQSGRVGAVPAADHQHDVHLLGELTRALLALQRRLTDSVEDAEFATPAGEGRHYITERLGALCGLYHQTAALSER